MALNTQGLALLAEQIQFVRNSVDPDMTSLSLALFIEVAKAPVNEGVKMAKLIEKFDLNPSTCSRAVYALSSGFVRAGQPRKGYGLVVSDFSEYDRRSLTVTLTQKGQQLAKGLMLVK